MRSSETRRCRIQTVPPLGCEPNPIALSEYAAAALLQQGPCVRCHDMDLESGREGTRENGSTEERS